MHGSSEKGVKDNLWLALLAVARAVATEERVESFLTTSLACLVEALGTVDAIAVLLRDAANGPLELKAAAGKVGDPMRPALSEIVAFLDASPLAEPLAQECIVVLPLQAGEMRLGLLVLETCSSPTSLNQADLPLLQDVADLMALAIQTFREREARQTAQAGNEDRQRKAELVSVLAHEMRTPLTSIKGYSTALLMEDAAFDPQTQREFLQIIDEECDVLQGLIRDLLEAAVIDAGLLSLEPQPTRLDRLATSVADDMSHCTPTHRFMVDFPRDLPIMDADPDRITQVLRNLLDNAVKYSPQGGLIVVRGETRGAEMVVSVADQGIGIAPEHLNRLFEKYFCIKAGASRGVAGSGLGLPIARGIVEAHGGRIWAESRLSQGSTFYFTLPAPTPGTRAAEVDGHV